jgi:hypothetical protein
MNECLKEWAGQEVYKEMNPFGVACTSIKPETQIQESWGKVQKHVTNYYIATTSTNIL